MTAIKSSFLRRFPVRGARWTRKSSTQPQPEQWKKGPARLFRGILIGDEILSSHRDSFITHEIRIPSLTNQSDSWNVGVAFLTGQVKAGWASGKKVHVIPVVNVEVSTLSTQHADDAIGTFGNNEWLDIKEQQLRKNNKKHQKTNKSYKFWFKLRMFRSRFLCLVVVDLRSNLTCNRSGGPRHLRTSHPQLLPQRLASHDEVPELANRGWRDYGPGFPEKTLLLTLMVAEIAGINSPCWGKGYSIIYKVL